MNRVFSQKEAKIVNCKSHAMLGIYYNNALQLEIDIILSTSNSKSLMERKVVPRLNHITTFVLFVQLQWEVRDQHQCCLLLR